MEDTPTGKPEASRVMATISSMMPTMHQPQSFFFQNKQTRQQQGGKISEVPVPTKNGIGIPLLPQYGIVKETVYKRNQQPRNEGDQNHIDGRHPSPQQQKAIE